VTTPTINARIESGTRPMRRGSSWGEGAVEADIESGNGDGFGGPAIELFASLSG
jgi:hypothetical protein